MQVLKGAAPVVNVMNPLQYLLMILNVFGTYAAMLVYPFTQHIFLAQDPRLMQPSLLTLLGITTLILPPFLARLMRRQTEPTGSPNAKPRPQAEGFSTPLLFGYSLLVISVLPVTNVLSLGLAYAAERLAYLPSVGFLLMLAAVAGWLLARSRPAASSYWELPQSISWPCL